MTKRLSKATEAAIAMNAARKRKLSPERRIEIARNAGLAGGRGRPKEKKDQIPH